MQRFRSEDLLTSVFPAQTACQENMAGADKEIPDHPLVKQTVHDCLTEAMDIVGLKKLFHRIEKGEVELIAKDTREPSPFAYQLINSYPFAYLDDAPAEDRRTRSISTRPAVSLRDLENLDVMDEKAIEQVSLEAWPEPRSADELYEILVNTPAFPLEQTRTFSSWADRLIEQKRATIANIGTDKKPIHFLVAAESLPAIQSVYKKAKYSPILSLDYSILQAIDPVEAKEKILKGWLEIKEPITLAELEKTFVFSGIETSLMSLESKGEILRCKWKSEEYSHWCARGLLRRIHRLTVETLREQIQPVSAEDYFEYLFDEHGLNLSGLLSDLEKNGDKPDSETLLYALQKLQGFEAPLGVWESELFSTRVPYYDPSWLDQLTAQGAIAFGRLTHKNTLAPRHLQKLNSVTPFCFSLRQDWPWISLNRKEKTDTGSLSSNTQLVLETLKQQGALFVDEIVTQSGLLLTQVENALGELVGEGMVICDQFHALRNMAFPKKPPD